MNTSFCIHTRGGNAFDPQTGQIDFIDITDIAHALSQLCRYAGHCDKFYSVAEHSVLVSRIVKKLWPNDLEAQWAGLMHDATEAYVGDVPTPLKVLLPDFSDIEHSLSKKVAKHFKIKQNKRVMQRVKLADSIALATEAGFLFKDVSHWATVKNSKKMPELLTKNFAVTPTIAKRRFLNEYRKLKKQLRENTNDFS